jgi:hypothetical protein
MCPGCVLSSGNFTCRQMMGPFNWYLVFVLLGVPVVHVDLLSLFKMIQKSLVHQSPGYFDHVSEVIVIIFKTYFENDQNILTSSLSMGFLPIKLMIIII